ncbi:MAG: hypothetical protein JSU87_02220 [Gemmatimonadota bacterium]|nr:MAG: hypothetical protein JSU87_02220 [Gemmatimonadota bacterium]
MYRHLCAALAAVTLSGCAGARGPVYEYRPSEAPLRYQINDHSDLLVQTPMGDQHNRDSTIAIVVLDVGQRTADAHEVSAFFETLDIWAGGDMNQQHLEGGDMLGKAFRGTLSDQGMISVSEAPEMPSELGEATDPAAIFADLLLPLPPSGDESAESWPHKTAMTVETAMTVNNSYDGSARFAGDTTWNGQAARIIVSEGTITSSGRGYPPGAPGEIEFTMSGTATTRYFWDPQRGVMLGSVSSAKAEGDLDLPSMAMTMPISFTGSKEVRLVR